MVLTWYEFISCSYLHNSHFPFHSKLALGLAFGMWKVVRSVTLWKFPYFFMRLDRPKVEISLFLWTFLNLCYFFFTFASFLQLLEPCHFSFSLLLLVGCGVTHCTSAFVALMMRKKWGPSSALQVLVGPRAGFFPWKHRAVPVLQGVDYAKKISLI